MQLSIHQNQCGQTVPQNSNWYVDFDTPKLKGWERNWCTRAIIIAVVNPHKIVRENPEKMCQKVMGYDANALYLCALVQSRPVICNNGKSRRTTRAFQFPFRSQFTTRLPTEKCASLWYNQNTVRESHVQKR